MHISGDRNKADAKQNNQAYEMEKDQSMCKPTDMNKTPEQKEYK